MKAHNGKWGNSLAIRIPSIYATELGLEEGAVLELTRVEDGVLLRPGKREYILQELLNDVTPKNIHGETDWGEPVGGETG